MQSRGVSTEGVVLCRCKYWGQVLCVAGEYLEGSDDENAEQEKSVSIAAMDVSDFEGGGVEGDDEQTVADDLDHQPEGGDVRQGPAKYRGNRKSPPPQPSAYSQQQHEYHSGSQPQPAPHKHRPQNSSHTTSAY